MFMYVENFHANAEKFYEIIDKLVFENSMFGDEVVNFHHNPPEILKTIETIVGRPVKYGLNSGVYRKPHEFVHYENFNPSSIYVGIVALEDVQMKIHKHKDTKSYHIVQITEPVEDFIRNNCFDKEKWETLADLKIYQGDMVLVQPWMFHSLEKKLVQIFHFEKLENNLDDENETKVEVNVKSPAKKSRKNKKLN